MRITASSARIYGVLVCSAPDAIANAVLSGALVLEAHAPPTVTRHALLTKQASGMR